MKEIHYIEDVKAYWERHRLAKIELEEEWANLSPEDWGILEAKKEANFEMMRNAKPVKPTKKG